MNEGHGTHASSQKNLGFKFLDHSEFEWLAIQEEVRVPSCLSFSRSISARVFGIWWQMGVSWIWHQSLLSVVQNPRKVPESCCWGAYLCGEWKVAGKFTEPTLHQIGENGWRMVETKRLLKTTSSAIHEHSSSMRAQLLSNNVCPKRLSLPLLMTQAGLDLLLHISSRYFASYHSYVLWLQFSQCWWFGILAKLLVVVPTKGEGISV